MILSFVSNYSIQISNGHAIDSSYNFGQRFFFKKNRSSNLKALEAQQAGLVSRLTPSGEARSEAIRVCEEIVKMSRSVTALGKAFYYTQIELKLADAYRLGETVMVENLRQVV